MAASKRKPAIKPKKPTRKEQALTAPPQSFWLGARMVTLGITSAQLANMLTAKFPARYPKLDRVTVWRWETGQREPDRQTRNDIAAVLGIEESALWLQPGFVDLNAVAAHIIDNDERQKLADVIRRLYPPRTR